MASAPLRKTSKTSSAALFSPLLSEPAKARTKISKLQGFQSPNRWWLSLHLQKVAAGALDLFDTCGHTLQVALIHFFDEEFAVEVVGLMQDAAAE